MITLSLCFIALLCNIDLLAQNYWIGGAPGQETNWNYARNWSQNQVPDWTEDVIITNVMTQSGYFPVISEEVQAVPHIEIQSNAMLTILPYGKLVIDGATTYKSGILLNGKLVATGGIAIANVAKQDIEQDGGEMYLRKGAWAGY
ncbi:MAG: hypothetical protein P1U56_12335 [Saprospiraceae bacterium]|nr:hypothetical protein [Saprospiraceae bacterium]MDF1696619.1 hypothetical protein [Saprospiraceae bacterium]